MGSETSGGGTRWIKPWSLGQGEQQARMLFERSFGGAPAGVWSSPGRTVLIGEHTDYNAGSALATVTPHRTFVAARARDDGMVRVVDAQAGSTDVWERPLDDLAPEGEAGPHVHVAGVPWALRERGYDGPGFDLAAASCIPRGSGLAGPAALETATAQALDGLWRLALGGSNTGRTELAEVCYDAENRYVGSPFGGVDHHTALRCRDGEAIELSFSSLPPPAHRYLLPFREYGLGLLVTRTAEQYPGVDAVFAERSHQCHLAAQLLGVSFIGDMADHSDAIARVEAIEDATLRRRARHIVTEIRRVEAVKQELSGIGPAHDRFTQIGIELYRSHASLEVDYDVSSPAQNRAVDAAFAAGALGARMFGAGRGGSTLALVRRAQAEQIAHAIHADLVAAGDPVPQFLIV